MAEVSVGGSLCISAAPSICLICLGREQGLKKKKPLSLALSTPRISSFIHNREFVYEAFCSIPPIFGFQVTLLNLHSSRGFQLHLKPNNYSSDCCKSAVPKMFGFMKSPMNKVFKNNDPGAPPFDSGTESDSKQIQRDSKRAASAPTLPGLNFKGEDQYKNDFRDSGGLENQSVQELEKYAAYKAKETTKTVNNCLKIAEDIREDATNTLATLHQQGEQINRTHMMAADMDKDLSKGEKLLGNLGGMFSRTWKPKKTKDITGPLITSDDSKVKPASSEQRQKLGVAPAQKGRTSQASGPEPSIAMQQVEGEMSKQDDGLTDLSNILGDLKNMAVDMGSELDRQNKALDHLSEDVDELNNRVKGANQRARKLLAK